MTQAFGIFQHINSMSVVWLHRLVALLWPQKHLYTDRFATRAEIQTLARETSYGLVLGVDASGQTLSVEATDKRPHLEHLAIFGPTGSGKTRREIRQLKKWKGSVSRWREIRARNDNACGESKSQNSHDSPLDLTFLIAATDPKDPIY